MRAPAAIVVAILLLDGIAPGRSRPGLGTVAIGPYLQDARGDGATVVWETDQPARGVVLLDTRHGERRFESAPSTHHEVRVSGLAPGSYHYRVLTDGAPAGAELATAPTADNFTFLVEGDTRDDDAAHAAVVAAMQRELPDLVLHVGDMVRDGADEAQWRRFFAIEQPLLASAPLYPAVGNHELIDDAGGVSYHRYFVLPGEGPARYYRFRVANTLFVSLDGNDSQSLVQARWLSRTLAEAAADRSVRHVFVFVHQPPFSSGIFCGLAPEQGLWIPEFERYKVRAVFSGHEHNYERLARNGVRYFVTGGGGAPLIAERTDCPDWDRTALRRFRAVHHFLRVRVRGDRAVLDAISSDGEVIDSVWLDEPPLSSEATASVPSLPGARGTQ